MFEEAFTQKKTLRKADTALGFFQTDTNVPVFHLS